MVEPIPTPPSVFHQPRRPVAPQNPPSIEELRQQVEKPAQPVVHQMPPQAPRQTQQEAPSFHVRHEPQNREFLDQYPDIPKPPKQEGQADTRKIIRSLPCGSIADGSSDNPSNYITIPDDGN
jgi:hypothetical protein